MVEAVVRVGGLVRVGTCIVSTNVLTTIEIPESVPMRKRGRNERS